MFIKRNRRRTGDSGFTSILLVEGERVPVGTRPRGRPRKDAPPLRTKVVHRVLANLSRLPPDLVELVDAYCKGQRGGGGVDAEATCLGPSFGALAALRALAEEAGIVSVFGSTRLARLALFLVLARVAHRGSRLSAKRWAEDQAVAQVLGLGSVDEDDLYEALDWLDREQGRIELELARPKQVGTVFLYDVTSSYLEGQQNELAAAGYNRDGKRFKKQVVVGLLTDADGDPVAVRVYRGDTADPKTVGDPIRLLAKDLGARDVVFVGDRGMLKSGPRADLAEAGFKYLTALTDAQIRKLLREGALRMELFDEAVAEVTLPGRRLLLRLNPDTRRRDRQRRADQLSKVRSRVERRNEQVRTRPRAQASVSLKDAQALLAMYRLDRYVTARLQGREVVLDEDPAKRADVELLDGCYVLDTDASVESMNKQTAHDRYMSLAQVERDFRTMKSGLLEIRPIFLRKANRTRAHAFVTMLGLKLARALESRVRDIGLTCQDALDRLAGIRLVTFADASLGLWRLPAKFAPPQREILDRLPALQAPLLSLTAKRTKKA